jgi:hypothetical protein
MLAASLTDEPSALALHDLLAPYADRLEGGGFICWGSVAHYLGMLATTLGRFDDAESRFAAASATHTRIDAPCWLARTRLEWARMLIARDAEGDAGRARDLLGQALHTAHELGLGTVERRSLGLLAELG